MNKLVSVFAPVLLLVCAGALGAQTVNLTSLTFNAQFAGPQVSQTLNIASSGGPTSFTAYSNASWLKLSSGTFTNVNQVNGATPATVAVLADPTGLNPGVYSGSISIYGTGPAVTVQVSLTVSAINVSPQSLQFIYTIGGNLPVAQNLVLSSQSLGFTAVSSDTWLQVSPTSGTSPATVTAALSGTLVPGLTPGTYNSSVTITPSGGSITTTPVVIPVTLTVTAAPPVIFSAGAIILAYQTGGANNLPQTLSLSTSGNQDIGFSLTFTADSNPSGRSSWVILNPSNGTIPKNGGPATISIVYDSTANLPAGTYTGKLSVLTPGAVPAQKDIPVQLVVSNTPSLVVPSASLNFIYELGGSMPASKAVTVQSTNAASGAQTGQMALTLNASANWISVPSTATTGTPFSVSVNPAGLPAGSYSGTVNVSAGVAANSPQSLNVALTIASDAILQTSVASLSFPYQLNQTSPPPQLSQTLSVSSSTGAPLNYSATAATTTCGSWLTLSGAATGVTNGSFTITANVTGLAAGTCSGSVTITATNASTGAAAIGSPATIPVTLYVTSTPSLMVSPLTLSAFTAPRNGSAPSPQTISLNSTTSGTPLSYTVALAPANCGSGWLFVSKTSGTTPDSLAISVALPPGTQPGTCTGNVNVTATGPGGTAVPNSPLAIPVTFQVTSGTLSLGVSTLSFIQTLGVAAPAAQTVAVSSTGQSLVYAAVASNPGSVAWLSVTPAGGTTSDNGTLSVSVDASRLTPGTYQGTVTVSSPSATNSPATITVNLTLNAGTISASPPSMSFTQAQGGPAPAAQPLTVTTSPGTIPFTGTVSTNTGGAWLSASSATTGGVVQVSASAGNLAVGTYTGIVTINAPSATGSPIQVAVTLYVVAPQTITASSTSPKFSYTLGTSAPPAQTIQLSTTGSTIPFTVNVTGGSSWLQVSPAAGTLPSTLTLSANTQGLGANTYTGTISISSPYSVTPLTITVVLTAVAIPPPMVVAIKNAANWQSGPLSPGENIVIGGTGLGPAALVGAQFASGGGLATTVGETQVLFDNTPAPIIYAWATQTSVMVPYEISGRPTTSIRVVYKGVQSDAVVYNVAAAAPGIYTLNQAGSGPPVVLNLDGASPISRGATIAFYMTGEGATSPASTTGGIALSAAGGLNKPVLPVTATVGGVTATVAYYGSAPGTVYGVMQVNVQIPANAPTGVQPLVVSVGAFQSQSAVTVTVQ